MIVLRAGTRGSDLAVWQTNWVCAQLRARHASVEIETVIIKTHGDVVADRNFGRDWPVGAFVSALEEALLEERIDFAVHSFKDLQTAETAGLTIAATPEREVVHDVLLTRGPMRLEDLPRGAKIGTNSPRRAAQLKALGAFEIVPIRGNVPTRIAKLERENLDAVVLAAAGLKRLGIEHSHRIDLPVDVVLPAPAQGALAVQARTGSAAAEIAAVLDDTPTRRCVTAERSFLQRIDAGCHTPVGALARVSGGAAATPRAGESVRAGVGTAAHAPEAARRGTDAASHPSGASRGADAALHAADAVWLRARLFSDDYARSAEGHETGDDPRSVGFALADRLLAELRSGNPNPARKGGP